VKAARLSLSVLSLLQLFTELESFDITAAAVRDTSGGCGQMYEIMVEASGFTNMSLIKRQMAVAKALKEDISQWHGFTMQAGSPGNTPLTEILAELRK